MRKPKPREWLPRCSCCPISLNAAAPQQSSDRHDRNSGSVFAVAYRGHALGSMVWRLRSESGFVLAEGQSYISFAMHAAVGVKRQSQLVLPHIPCRGWSD
jgi:hypothetical protein